MAYIDEQLFKFKYKIEEAIRTGGAKGKTSCIRSAGLINLIHDAVKHELIEHGVLRELISPPFGETKPEIKLAGHFKQKNQDVCVLPKKIDRKETKINWGAMALQNRLDPYGSDYSNNMLVINVRSQMSSLAKNADTLFERTFAEALNLHLQYSKMVLGEVYLIPVFEYDDNMIKDKIVGFKTNQTDVEKYISFFDFINNRNIHKKEPYKYERCTLLVVDFKPEKPILYRNNDELKKKGIISKDFTIDYAKLGFDSFAEDIIDIYAQRHDIRNIQDINRIERLEAYAEKMRIHYEET